MAVDVFIGECGAWIYGRDLLDALSMYFCCGEEQQVITTVDVHEARNLLKLGHRYLDVRTEEEFKNGHVENSLNIPYMFSTPEVLERCPLNLIRMLQQLGNAKFITLTMSTIEVLAMDPNLLEQNASPFCDLKHLKLKKKLYDPNFTVPENVMNYLTMGSLHGSSPVVQSSIG